MSSTHSHAHVLIAQGVFDSIKTFREFEQRVSALIETNTTAQGDAFEIFVEAYLATQPILQCQNTWLVGNIPVEIRDRLNLPNDSKGIDGVYQSVVGDVIPYQVKFRSNRPGLGFNEVAPFLGITERAPDRLLITNCDTIVLDVQNRTGIRSLRGVDFDRLTQDDFTVIENWLKKNPTTRKRLTPDPHQVDALANIAKHLTANDRGTVWGKFCLLCSTVETNFATQRKKFFQPTLSSSKMETITVAKERTDMEKEQKNIDVKVVEDFGKEWETFNQQSLKESDLQNAFNQYFDIFPFDKINSDSEGFDMGCGSGRWAKLIAPKVGKLNCIDPSLVALQQAKLNLKTFINCDFECASVSDSKLKESSQDFGYCLGVLHHIPNTIEGLQECAKKLKRGAPFLLYLYYRFDNKPLWFKAIWVISDLVRRVVSSMPFKVKLFISQIIALSIYWPLSRISLVLEKTGRNVSNIPLSDYRNKPIYFLRTDALDRFGTKLEKRFTKAAIEKMLLEVGFKDIRFSSSTPYWVVVATKI